jgi:hypothetical protein
VPQFGLACSHAHMCASYTLEMGQQTPETKRDEASFDTARTHSIHFCSVRDGLALVFIVVALASIHTHGSSISSTHADGICDGNSKTRSKEKKTRGFPHTTEFQLERHTPRKHAQGDWHAAKTKLMGLWSCCKESRLHSLFWRQNGRLK